MVLANVDSIVAADQIEGQERVLILYRPLILVSRTVAGTYPISLYLQHVSSPQLCTRLAIETNTSTKQASTTQRAKRCKKALLRTKTRYSPSSWYTQPCNKVHRWIVGHASFDLANVLSNMPDEEESPPLANGILNG